MNETENIYRKKKIILRDQHYFLIFGLIFAILACSTELFCGIGMLFEAFVFVKSPADLCTVFFMSLPVQFASISIFMYAKHLYKEKKPLRLGLFSTTIFCIYCLMNFIFVFLLMCFTSNFESFKEIIKAAWDDTIFNLTQLSMTSMYITLLVSVVIGIIVAKKYYSDKIQSAFWDMSDKKRKIIISLIIPVMFIINAAVCTVLMYIPSYLIFII